MNEEYILIPILNKVILPYENTNIIISKTWKVILDKQEHVILAFYKKNSIENTILLEEVDNFLISKYATLVSIIHMEDSSDNNDEIILEIKGISRVLLLDNKFIYEQNIYMTKVSIYNPVILSDVYKDFNDIRLSICDILQSQQANINIYHGLSMLPLEFFYFVVETLYSDNIISKLLYLEENNIMHGLKNILELFFHLNKVFKEKIEQDIYTQFKKNIETHQKKYLLNEQMKVIQQELDPNIDDHNLEDEIKNHLHIPENIKKLLLKEYEKIRHHNPLSSEYVVTKNYLSISLSLPWGKFSILENITLKIAEDILNKDHYALDDIKDNILQYLATAFKTQQNNIKVLLLVGPPGVGKTSIGNSIAKCLNREFIFISLASIMDVADLVGHRRTYVGAYTGLLITKIIEKGTANPLIFLDEVDKIKKNTTDPMNVLVSLLDPTQNHNFTDNFLGYAFDMSKAVFILTANSTENIPDYLLSRMEIVYMDGYSLYDKIHIAKDFLIPKLYKNFNISKKDICITRDTIPYIIQYYTKEMGVRFLNKFLENLFSKAIYIHMKQEEKGNKNLHTIINKKDITKFTKNIPIDFDIKLKHSEALGLAWTSVGGDVLKIESMFFASKQVTKPIITGNVRKIMEESILVAYSLVQQSNLLKTKIMNFNKNFFNEHNLHVHVPEGAIPKDGPSAGITIYTSILSALLNLLTDKQKVLPLIAMTGEISLSQEILPIGGIKQKLLAVLMYKVKEVILPLKNKIHVHNLKGVPLQELKIHFVSHITQLEDIMFNHYENIL